MAARLHELESKLLKQQEEQRADEARREQEWKAKIESKKATDEELEQRRLQEAAMQAKQRELEAKLQQQIKETERLAKSQERKRQQRSLLDEQLLRTLPLVHEVVWSVANVTKYLPAKTFCSAYCRRILWRMNCKKGCRLLLSLFLVSSFQERLC